MSGRVRAPAQGAARVVADDAAADRRPGCSCVVGLTSPLLAKFLPEIVKAAAGDQLPTIPIPTPVAADAVDQLWKNLAQFGAFAAIVLAMGSVATERDRGTAAFVLSKTVVARDVPRGQGRRARARPRGVHRAVGGRRLDLHGHPVRAAAGRRLDRVRGAGLAGPRGLGGHHVPRLDGDRVRPPRPPGSGSGRCWSCRSSRPSRTSGQFLPGGLAEPAIALAAGVPVAARDVVVPVVSTVVLIALAVGAASWSFRRQEL